MGFLSLEWIGTHEIGFSAMLLAATALVFVVPIRGMKGLLVVSILLCILSAWIQNGAAFLGAWCAFIAWMRFENGARKV